MTEHEFYADPTVFDFWQDRTGSWFCSRAAILRPYAWSVAFSGLAVTLLGVAIGVLVYSVWHRLDSTAQPAWNQSAAQWLTVFMALLSCHCLLGQALGAWPRDRALPRRLQVVALLCAGSAAVSAGRTPVAAPASLVTGSGQATTREIRTFYAGVRAAGINVTIAQALFAAGIRSAQQLRERGDAELLRIQGVGRASVRRLRVHFR